MTVVSPRATRRETISSSRANASALAAMSSSPAADHGAQPVAGHDRVGREVLRRPASTSRTRSGPASTSRQGAGSRTATPVGWRDRSWAPQPVRGARSSRSYPAGGAGCTRRPAGAGWGVRAGGLSLGGHRAGVHGALGQPLLHVLGDLVLPAALPDPDQHQHRDAVGDAQHQQHHAEPGDPTLQRLGRPEVDPGDDRQHAEGDQVEQHRQQQVDRPGDLRVLEHLLQERLARGDQQPSDQERQGDGHDEQADVRSVKVHRDSRLEGLRSVRVRDGRCTEPHLVWAG